MKLTAIIYPDSDSEWLVAECPEIGTASQGKTEDEALANLREATELYLESFPEAHPKTAAISRRIALGRRADFCPRSRAHVRPPLLSSRAFRTRAARPGN